MLGYILKVYDKRDRFIGYWTGNTYRVDSKVHPDLEEKCTVNVKIYKKLIYAKKNADRLPEVFEEVSRCVIEELKYEML